MKNNLLGQTMASEYDLSDRPCRVKTLADDEHVYTGEVVYDDLFGRLSEVNEQVGVNRTGYTTTFGYDEENRPTTLTYGDHGQTTVEYDRLGRVSRTSVKAGSGAAKETAYTFVSGGHGTNSTTSLIKSISQTGGNFSYSYDDNGNIVSVVQDGVTTSYTYDALGQLIRVDDAHDVTDILTTGSTWEYEYDQGGNILSKKRYPYGDVSGAPVQTISFTYGNANWKDQLTAVEDSANAKINTAITYDAIGNPLNDGTWTYTWQNGRQLHSMTKPGMTMTYVYNEQGLRVQKTQSFMVMPAQDPVTTNYTLHGKNIVHMTQGSNNLHFFYDAQNKPAVVVYNGTAYSYVKNLQGDIVAILDSAGSVVVQYKYDAWGKPISKTGSMASTLGTVQPFRYRGYVYDEETGLYYLRSRYYAPASCRFINADVLLYQVGVLFSSNSFLYCANTPVAYADIDGYEASECEHVFFKNTYYLSGEVFYSYLLWQYSRHPNEAPAPPVIDALKEITGMVAGQAIDELDNWFTTAKKAQEYSFPIIGPFLNYNYAVEGYIVGEMERNCSGPGGYQDVRIELLYGSHSAEVRLTLADQKGNIVNCNVIDTQGYNVILDMMDSLKLLVDEFGGTYYHEGVGWKYSMAE